MLITTHAASLTHACHTVDAVGAQHARQLGAATDRNSTRHMRPASDAAPPLNAQRTDRAASVSAATRSRKAPTPHAICRTRLKLHSRNVKGKKSTKWVWRNRWNIQSAPDRVLRELKIYQCGTKSEDCRFNPQTSGDLWQFRFQIPGWSGGSVKNFNSWLENCGNFVQIDAEVKR